MISIMMFFADNTIPLSVQRAYGLTILDAVAMSGGFSGAAVFRATASDGRELAIRRTPNSATLPPERLRRLRGLLHQVSQSGCQFIPVPLMPAKPEAKVQQGEIRLDLPWVQVKDYIWQVEPWMPGSPLTGHELTTPHLKAGLIALNQFHQRASEAVRVVGSDEWFLNVTTPSPAVLRRLSIVVELQAGLLQKLEHRLREDPDQTFRSLAVRVCEALTTWLPWLQKELKALASIRFPVQPVLRDIWRAHTLYTACEVTGLIDLNAAASDHVTVDLARLFRSWYGSDISRIQRAVKEYQLLRILSGPEQRLLQTLDASTVLLSPVTWLRRRMEPGERTNSTGDVIARLAELTDVVGDFRPLFGE